ncbi:MAG TPA: 3-deoxy-manno-octulosonate cytidylyltransferase [Phycisphaerales bacterium]|nr:3-deoxy-manno-octulosonate cytidylyltransferase [Phycisphaerales bacterium]
MARALAIVPARMGSTRFPGKVLASETGRPLIAHVVEGARRARGVSRVVVATDDERVRRAVESFGGECVMTSPDHPNGTSRLAEACGLLGVGDDEVVVNVQGDEPEIDAALIDAAVAALESSGAEAATVAVPFDAADDPGSANIVKVVRRLDGSALYFSRALIPFDRDGAGGDASRPLRHVGLYAYRRSFLRRYRGLAPTPLEEAERLEQLRVLEHGFRIAVAMVECPAPAGIDTPEQYEAFVRRWRSHASPR